MKRDRCGDEIDNDAGGITAEHDPYCRNGWLGSEDFPRPCPICRPWLVTRNGNWIVDRARLRAAS